MTLSLQAQMLKTAGVPTKVWTDKTACITAGVGHFLEIAPEDLAGKHILVQGKDESRVEHACMAISKVIALRRQKLRFTFWFEWLSEVSKFERGGYMDPEHSTYKFVRGQDGGVLCIWDMFLRQMPPHMDDRVENESGMVELRRHTYEGGVLMVGAISDRSANVFARQINEIVKSNMVVIQVGDKANV